MTVKAFRVTPSLLWQRFVSAVSILLFGIVSLLVGANVAATENEDPVQWSFVLGSYLLIGRAPDSQRTYTGTAQIDRVNGKLRLIRQVAGKRSEVFGVVRRAKPGEAYVLSFDWGNPRRMEMVCVIGSDLDNYARLTCRWGDAGNPHKQPGMEAYFAQVP